jgi:hypothetical protein
MDFIAYIEYIPMYHHLNCAIAKMRPPSIRPFLEIKFLKKYSFMKKENIFSLLTCARNQGLLIGKR